MPARHTYKCLNPRCKPNKNRPITFSAMNSPQPTCPDCGSDEISPRHHEATFAVPECDYSQCDECDHQWGHQ